MEFKKPEIDQEQAEKFGSAFMEQALEVGEQIAKSSGEDVTEEMGAIMGVASVTAGSLLAFGEQVKQLAAKVQEVESTARVDRLLAYLELLQDVSPTIGKERIKAVCLALDAELGISVLKTAE